MADGRNYHIRVSPEKLLTSANTVEEKIRTVQKAFRSMDQIINGSRSQWQGDGYNAYARVYRQKADMVNTALRRFQENADDLRTISGEYTKAENAAVETSQDLQVDLIV